VQKKKRFEFALFVEQVLFPIVFHYVFFLLFL